MVFEQKTLIINMLIQLVGIYSLINLKKLHFVILYIFNTYQHILKHSDSRCEFVPQACSKHYNSAKVGY